MEYMFWNKKVFGYYSPEYISTLLDTSVWIGGDSCLFPNTKYYLRHPAYRHYPVVGVSQKQAEEYSKWRSDRVFEYLLTKYEIITYDSAQTKENYFTIEKYFHGELKNVISDYPEMQSDIVPCVSGPFKGDPTRNVSTNCCSKKGNPIYNLRGNVSEWLSEKDITAGGGWKDTRTQILTSDLFVTTEANAWTGFRNVCKWKKWEE
jgi:formylglycine-generating enzyme required for sulfatase activity